MNLETDYMGLKLAHPILPGASPLVDKIDQVRRLEDAGAPAIVMHSLFEEQIEMEQNAEHYHRERHEESFGEATSYFPNDDEFALGPDEYLKQIQRIRDAVKVPVIGSLNGVRLGGWVDYAGMIQQAGASALELNMYFLPTDPSESAADIERRMLEIVRAVKSNLSIPLAIKLSPRFSSLPHFVQELDVIGVDGVILFNRFYQPDIDINSLEVTPSLELSHPSELRQRIRWLAILYGQAKASLIASGGVHKTQDVIKAIMAGADGVQVVSSLLKFGPEHLQTLIMGFRSWIEQNEYDSLSRLRGSMSLQRAPNPEALERANYLRMLQVWRT